MAQLTVTTGELSKALTNAEGWLPSRSPVPVALVAADRHELVITVTDTYSAGQATCPVDGHQGKPAEAVEISRADLLALAKRARADGTKKGLSRITVETGPRAGVIFHGMTDDPYAETVTALDASRHGFRPEWSLLDEMFALAEEKAVDWPGGVLVNTGYLALFNKVRPDATGRGVHLRSIPDTRVILGKVGPHFRGLVMAMDEVRNEAALGQGGLW
ncbi:hypothetical protein [Nonomuraea sp. NPDC023979]|uniref:hypothetical protein n=1 Tax=Nonomuraea sp. NPDC023979 TaxID=3154796 RepID=UPI0033D5DB39